MIDYEGGRYQVCFIWRLTGSVFPRACVYAIPAGVLGAVLKGVVEPLYQLRVLNNAAAYSAFSFVIGFLLVFRTQQAYSHFWEGTTLMQLLRGQWIGAFSSLLAFSSTSQEGENVIEEFRYKLIRLFSLLHATALQYVATMDGEQEEFDILGIVGLDDTTVRFIAQTPEDSKIYVTIQWIQQLILVNLNTGILPVPAPIVSRVFQDLSTGIVTLNNARKISDTPFPFPYAQMMTVALLIHFLVTPVVVSPWCDSWWAAFSFSFVPVFAFWSINFIAAEIEQPFGSDPNDINIVELQKRFNTCLVSMLDPQVAHAPTLKHSAVKDQMGLWDRADTLRHAYEISMKIESHEITKALPANKGWRRQCPSLRTFSKGPGAALESVVLDQSEDPNPCPNPAAHDDTSPSLRSAPEAGQFDGSPGSSRSPLPVAGQRPVVASESRPDGQPSPERLAGQRSAVAGSSPALPPDPACPTTAQSGGSWGSTTVPSTPDLVPAFGNVSLTSVGGPLAAFEPGTPYLAAHSLSALQSAPNNTGLYMVGPNSGRRCSPGRYRPEYGESAAIKQPLTSDGGLELGFFERRANDWQHQAINGMSGVPLGKTGTSEASTAAVDGPMEADGRSNPVRLSVASPQFSLRVQM